MKNPFWPEERAYLEKALRELRAEAGEALRASKSKRKQSTSRRFPKTR